MHNCYYGISQEIKIKNYAMGYILHVITSSTGGVVGRPTLCFLLLCVIISITILPIQNPF